MFVYLTNRKKQGKPVAEDDRVTNKLDRKNCTATLEFATIGVKDSGDYELTLKSAKGSISCTTKVNVESENSCYWLLETHMYFLIIFWV